MDKNPQAFDVQEAIRLANTPAGKQLIQMLQQSDPEALNQASQHARSGNYSQALSAVKKILSTPEGQELIKKFGR